MTDSAVQFQTAMEDILREHYMRYPLMNEEDVVKFAFQGMLGVGHLISSEARARDWLHREMEGLIPDGEEPLTEKLSQDWARLNLRAAKAQGIPEADIACMLFLSANKPLAFTRKDVYGFCVSIDGSEKMKAVAEQILNENFLPSHSERYRQAYAPAYRVIHRDCLEHEQDHPKE